ncbi:MAG TPA: BTAD domain-containing putative transcriptional regulator [Acidimicrobiia bacterium]|nr:BTAD domain-containing putative transcriptional regulator [Acidimicrobiia bacterium]
MLDIRLLGSPIVTVDGETIDVDTKKAIAMLAYLVVERVADREGLSGLFWADSPPDRARGTLRRTLSALRSAIGPGAIDADRSRVELTADYRSDLATFDAAISETRGHGHDGGDVCDRCVAPLSTAAELYRGDFLGPFAIKDAPDFEDWARSVTESYRLKAGSAFQRLAMALAGTGDYGSAIDAAARWIDLDELHEPAYRLLMLLNAWAGDRPGAIQAYRQCVAVLDRELGVPPLEETTELYEAILDEDLPPAPGARRTVRAVQRVDRVPNGMLDRTDAVATLEQALAGGEGGICVITGDSWMGKTRLLEHLRGEASQRGFFEVSGRAYRAETDLAFGVATQLLRGLMDDLDHQAVPSWALEELSRLDPRLSHGQSAQSNERLGQLRLREAFLTLVQVVAERGPTLLDIDDGQWMDTASAELLAYVLRRHGTGHCVFVIGTRDLDSLDPSLHDVLSSADVRVHLGPLGVEDIAAEFPDVDVGPIIEATGGIPLLVQEAIESPSDTGRSTSVIRYMDARSERLTDLSRQVMAGIAVLDGMCDAQLLRDTSGRTDDEIVEAVEELAAAGLIQEDADGHLGFTLDVLEGITYESTSLVRRRLLHGRAAEALEARPRSRTDARLATAIAGHMRRAGNEDAADWYRLSGDLARAVFANSEAVASYENAIALGHPDLGGLHLCLGELALARGDYQTATRELRAAASQVDGPELAHVEHRIGDLNRLLGRFALAEESFERARPEHPEPAELYADWALLKHRTGKSGEATTMATMALDAAANGGDERRVARALNILGVVSPDAGTALDYFERALETAGPNSTVRMAALNNKAQRLSETGAPEPAIALIEEAIALAGRTGYRHHQAALLNHLADLNHRMGREQEANEALTEAVTIFADIDAGDWEPEVWLLREW